MRGISGQKNAAFVEAVGGEMGAAPRQSAKKLIRHIVSAKGPLHKRIHVQLVGAKPLFGSLTVKRNSALPSIDVRLAHVPSGPMKR